jgi:cell division protein FtsQ
MRQSRKLTKPSKQSRFSFEGTLNGVQKFLDGASNTKSKSRPSKRGKKTSSLRMGYIYLAGALILLLSTYGVIHYHLTSLLVSYTTNKLVNLSSAMGLKIDNIYVEGRQHASQYQVLDAVHAKRGDPILAFNIEEIKDKLERVDWVRSAIVQRRLPNILFIQIIERKPIAVWHHQDTMYLVDNEGVAITPTSMEPFSGLPLIIGTDAPLYAPQILGVIEKFPEISKHLTSVTRVRERRWDLTIDERITVRLPETNIEEALGKLSLLLEQKKINANDITLVDLRVPKQIIIRASRIGAVGLKMKGKDT